MTGESSEIVGQLIAARTSANHSVLSFEFIACIRLNSIWANGIIAFNFKFPADIHFSCF